VIVHIGQTVRCVADEAAAELLDGGAQPGDGAGLQPDVVVEEQHVPGQRQVEQVRPVLGQSPQRQVPRQQDGVATVAQYPHHPGHRVVVPPRYVVGLVADHHAEVHVLGGEPGQARGQFGGPVPRRYQHVEVAMREESGRIARIERPWDGRGHNRPATRNGTSQPAWTRPGGVERAT